VTQRNQSRGAAYAKKSVAYKRAADVNFKPDGLSAREAG